MASIVSSRSLARLAITLKTRRPGRFRSWRGEPVRTSKSRRPSPSGRTTARMWPARARPSPENRSPQKRPLGAWFALPLPPGLKLDAERIGSSCRPGSALPVVPAAGEGSRPAPEAGGCLGPSPRAMVSKRWRDSTFQRLTSWPSSESAASIVPPGPNSMPRVGPVMNSGRDWTSRRTRNSTA